MGSSGESLERVPASIRRCFTHEVGMAEWTMCAVLYGDCFGVSSVEVSRLKLPHEEKMSCALCYVAFSIVSSVCCVFELGLRLVLSGCRVQGG